ncbi:hypothetical protein DOS59_10845 [Staphylococcus felis]|nr:hypothetical protein DOS59_10845 [Staphylococcus felis]
MIKFSIKFPFRCNNKEKINYPIKIALNLENLLNNKLKNIPLNKNSSQVATIKGCIISSVFIEKNSNIVKIITIYKKSLHTKHINNTIVETYKSM